MTTALRARLRLASALVMLAFVISHLSAHSLLLVSLPLALDGLVRLMQPWRSAAGSTLLLTAFFLHYANAVWSIYERRSLRLTRWQWAQLGRPGNVDRWQIIRFEAPCTIVLDVGVALAGTGAPQGDRSQGVTGRVLNTITPESAGTCMYFWTLLRNYRLRDQSLTTQLREANARIFEEDRAVVEAQQRAIAASPEQPLHNLNVDAGALWARRIIERLSAEA